MDNNDNDKLFDFIKDAHGRMLTLCVRQPYASDLATGRKAIEIFSRTTDKRGDVLICSTSKFEYIDMMRSATIGIAELYDIKPVSELTQEEWSRTRVKTSMWGKLDKGYAWMFRNARRIVEHPVIRPVRGISYTHNISEDNIFIYPKYVIYDKYMPIDKVNEFLKQVDHQRKQEK